MRTNPSSHAVLVAFLLLAFVRHAHGAPAKQSEKQSEPSALATVAAIVPGLLLHGAGHYVAGEKKTAKKLLLWEGIGIGLMAVSAATIGFSGASRYGNEVTIPLLIAGSGIFLNTAFADIYGSATGGRESRYQAPVPMTVSLGYGYVYDPQFSYANFSIAAARVQRGQVVMAPSIWVAIDADNQRSRLPLAYRFADNGVGDFLQAESAMTYHRYGDDNFSHFIGEVSVSGRADLERLGASLAGSFITARIGYALHRTNYDVPNVPADTIALLLGRNSYGLYLPRGGEIEGYYEHRRDGYSAGLSPSSRNGSGFLGHFGLALRQPIHDHLALAFQTEIGAAWVSTLSVEFRNRVSK